jgi:hypothetical protein
MAYASVFGTRDYMVVNTRKWEAYRYLTKTKKIRPSKINAGFEPNNWNGDKDNWWYVSREGGEYDYLIQYNTEPGFKPLKEYPFRRWFPIKEDKITIFVREEKFGSP